MIKLFFVGHKILLSENSANRVSAIACKDPSVVDLSNGLPKAMASLLKINFSFQFLKKSPIGRKINKQNNVFFCLLNIISISKQIKLGASILKGGYVFFKNDNQLPLATLGLTQPIFF
jgi:hypothetical protein